MYVMLLLDPSMDIKTVQNSNSVPQMFCYYVFFL